MPKFPITMALPVSSPGQFDPSGFIDNIHLHLGIRAFKNIILMAQLQELAEGMIQLRPVRVILIIPAWRFGRSPAVFHCGPINGPQ